MKTLALLLLLAAAACEVEVGQREVGAGIVTTRQHRSLSYALGGRGYYIARYSVGGRTWDHVYTIEPNARGDVFIVQWDTEHEARAFTVDVSGHEHAFAEAPYVVGGRWMQVAVAWCGNDTLVYELDGALKAATLARALPWLIDAAAPGRRHPRHECSATGELGFTALTRQGAATETPLGEYNARDGTLDLYRWSVRDGVQRVATWPEKGAAVWELTDVMPYWHDGALTWCRMPRPYPCTFETSVANCAECIRP